MNRLREYQSRALDQMRSKFRAGTKRIMLYSPTGSGKTEIAMAMVKGAVARGLRVAFICNRIQLVLQASARFHQAGIEHGIIQGDNSCNTNARVLICSIQTVARRGLPTDLGLIIVDEAHGTAGSVDYRRFIAQRNCLPMVGLTATPFSRGLGKRYTEIGGPLWQDLVTAATIRELIDMGFLVDVDIYAPSTPDLSNVKIVAGDYHEGQLGEAVDKPTLIGDIVDCWHKYAAGKPTVCFATNIAHSNHIVQRFRESGIPTEHIDCYVEQDERNAIMARVARGETKIISNVAILAEGWDQPDIECMILARPTRSLIRYVQMAGRVLRPFAGKDRSILLDHSGSSLLLGYPTDDLPLVLDDGSPRKAAKKDDDEKPEMVECPACHYVKPRKIHACPKCGFEPQRKPDVRNGDGDLILVKRRGKTINVPEKEMRQFLAEMTGYAEEKGFKRGWAYHQFEEKYGIFPKDVGICWADPKPLTEFGRGWITHRAIKHRYSSARR